MTTLFFVSVCLVVVVHIELYHLSGHFDCFIILSSVVRFNVVSQLK